MSGLTTFNIRCHNIIQNANLAIISHITKQKTKKSKNPQGKQSPKQVPCAAALPQPRPPVPATAVPQSQPQQSPSPSHNCPPVPATAVPQSQPQLSTMLRCHRSHPASIPASEVPHATAPPQPPHVPQLPPSPSHTCPPVPATAVPQSQPQLSPSPSHNCPPCCDAIAATQPASQQARSPMPRHRRGHNQPQAALIIKRGPPCHGSAVAQNPWPQNPLQKVHAKKNHKKFAQ